MLVAGCFMNAFVERSAVAETVTKHNSGVDKQLQGVIGGGQSDMDT